MNDLTILVFMIFAVALACTVNLVKRAARHLLGALMALGTDSDSLSTRVFPLLGFIGMLVIMMQLNVF